MVLDEHLGYQEHEAQAGIASLEKSARELSKLFREDISRKIPHLDASAVTIRRESIEEMFKILPTAYGAEHDGLIREICRVRPTNPEFNDEKGVPEPRDAVIWLTVLAVPKPKQTVVKSSASD
jgi:hypothetical protein